MRECRTRDPADPDFVTAIGELAADAGLNTEAVRALTLHLRRDWGGCRPYIRKTATAEKSRDLARSLAAGLNLREAFAEAGVSRSSGYRLLARRCR